MPLIRCLYRLTRMIPLKLLDPRHFWAEVPLLTRLFGLFLCFVALHTIYSSAVVLTRLRSFTKNLCSKEHSAVLQSTLLALRARITNIRQILFFTLFLFGLCFFLQIPVAFQTLGASNIPGINIIFRQLGTYFESGTDVFIALLFLHSLQWIVSARVQSAERRLIFRETPPKEV